MKVAVVLMFGALLALGGCGGESEPGDGGQATQAGTSRTQEGGGEEKPAPGPEDDGDSASADSRKSGGAAGDGGGGMTVAVGDSEFGRMLYGSNDQAIYIFENDRAGKTVCYGECAAAWPPVVTEGPPQAGRGVKQSLLGTVERRNGEHQVTYAGQPLYFYANEGPGEVRCHNVDLNGGFWWVVGPDGERRA